jgi:hypothetical protein
LDNSETGKGKEIVTSKQQKVLARINKLSVKISPEKMQEFREVTKLLNEDSAEQQQGMIKASQRFFADKQHFELLNTTMQIDHNTALNNSVIFYAIDYLETRLSNLENIVQGLTKLNISNMEERIQKLQETLNEPKLAEVTQFIQELNKSIQKAKQAQDDYVQ